MKKLGILFELMLLDDLLLIKKINYHFSYEYIIILANIGK